MNPTLEAKLAKLVTNCEETDRGGVNYGDGQKHDVWPEVRAILQDPEVIQWVDERRRAGITPLRRL